MANEPLQLNLGSLRSAMSLTLHTHHASRIWHGRAPADGRPGIIGLNGYISVMNKMKRGADLVTMKDINKRKYCGACHNGVTAFPPGFSECDRCHS